MDRSLFKRIANFQEAFSTLFVGGQQTLRLSDSRAPTPETPICTFPVCSTHPLPPRLPSTTHLYQHSNIFVVLTLIRLHLLLYRILAKNMPGQYT